LDQAKACSPTCSGFKCTKNSIFYHREGAWCGMTEEVCDLTNCTYAMCMKRRMLPQGICGETVKRKTVEKDLEEADGVDVPVKLKGKAFRKFGERDIF
jgi:hypothetical protein